MKANKSLLFHRQVTIVDIFTVRVLVEFMAYTTTLAVLSIIFFLTGLLDFPEDVLKVLAGWLLTGWFAAGLGMTVGGLAEKSPAIGRLWHPFSYGLMLLSGIAFTVDSLPPSFRHWILWVPTINSLELMRQGWFGSEMVAYYSIPYIVGFNVMLTVIGISLVRQIGFDSSTDE